MAKEGDGEGEGKAAPRHPMMWGDGSSAPEAKIELPALTQRVSDRQPERARR